MAEEKKDKKPKKHTEHKGGIPFGLEVLLFILAIFIIWILTGGIKQKEDKPFITPLSDMVNPGMKYGPEDVKSNYNSIYEPTDSIN